MIEKLRQQDLPVIRSLILQEFPYVKKPALALEAKLGNPFFFLFRAMHEKKLAGFCEIEVLEENKTVRLNALAVLPEFRKKGLGKKLLKETIGFLKKRGFETLWLLVRRDNSVAQKIYEKQGFVWIDTMPEKIDNAVVEEYCLELQVK